MAIFELILAVVVVVTVAGIINNFINFKFKNQETMNQLDERVEKLEDLEQRIKVLETIITDQNYDLEQKINSL